MSVWRTASRSLEQDIMEGENPVCDQDQDTYYSFSKSRVVWECSSKSVLDFNK
ncbi:4497_t:CDS:1, partial [Diversispora eburnea]